MPDAALRRRGRGGSREGTGRLWAALCLGCLAALVAGGVAVWSMVQRAADVGHAEAEAFAAVQELAGEEGGVGGADGLAVVDWDFWRKTNPDVVAWLIVPGTEISTPVVQARQDDPTYYLGHDVYGEPNVAGCAYVDARCRRFTGSSGCECTLIAGHNLGWGSRLGLADFARFLDADYAREHAQAYLLTPDGTIGLQVCAVDCVDGSTAESRVSFDDAGDLASWLGERAACAEVRLRSDEDMASLAGSIAEGDRAVFAFATCSYTRWANERTVVYAVQG